MAVERLPVKYRRPRLVEGRDMYCMPEPSEEMVWEVCPYLRSNHDDSRCEQCSRWEEDQDYGEVQRMCFGLAEDACRVVMVMQALETAEDK